MVISRKQMMKELLPGLNALWTKGYEEYKPSKESIEIEKERERVENTRRKRRGRRMKSSRKSFREYE